MLGIWICRFSVVGLSFFPVTPSDSFPILVRLESLDLCCNSTVSSYHPNGKSYTATFALSTKSLPISIGASFTLKFRPIYNGTLVAAPFFPTFSYSIACFFLTFRWQLFSKAQMSRDGKLLPAERKSAVESILSLYSFKGNFYIEV